MGIFIQLETLVWVRLKLCLSALVCMAGLGGATFGDGLEWETLEVKSVKAARALPADARSVRVPSSLSEPQTIAVVEALSKRPGIEHLVLRWGNGMGEEHASAKFLKAFPDLQHLDLRDAWEKNHAEVPGWIAEIRDLRSLTFAVA